MEATGTGSAFKNFWTTNEGRWGKIGLVLLAGGSLFAAYVKLLPFLSKVIWDSVHLAIGAAIIGAIVIPLTDARVRESLSFIYKWLVTGFHNFAKNLDPIQNMKDQLKERKNKLDGAKSQFEKLGGQIREAERLFTDVQEKYLSAKAAAQEALKLAGQCTDPSEEGVEKKTAYLRERVVQAERAEGYRMFGETLKKQLADMNRYKKFLRRVQSYSEWVIRRKETRLELLELKMKQAKAVFSIFRTLKEVWQGKSSDEALYKESEDAAEMQISEMFGAVDSYMDEGAGFIAKMDVEQGSAAAEALEALARQGDQLMSDPALKQITSEVPNGEAEESTFATPATRKGGSMGTSTVEDPMEKFLG